MGDEENRKSVISPLHELSNDVYNDIIEKFEFDKNRIKKNSEDKLKRSLNQSPITFLGEVVNNMGRSPRIPDISIP